MVSTPIDRYKRPDLSPLVRASEALGKVVNKGVVVIYEFATYLGAAEGVCLPILEQLTVLTCFIKEGLADAMGWYVADLSVPH